MFCPKCHAEYVAGFTICSDCLLPLVDELPEPKEEPRHEGGQLTDPVRVLRSGYQAHIVLAQSILRSAGIPFVVLNQTLQQLTGLGYLAPAEILVSRADAEDALVMLHDLLIAGPGGGTADE